MTNLQGICEGNALRWSGATNTGYEMLRRNAMYNYSVGANEQPASDEVIVSKEAIEPVAPRRNTLGNAKDKRKH